MSRKAHSPYSGKLATPMPRRRRDRLLGVPETTREWKAELRKRFSLLLRHYGLARDDPDLWPKLAILLMFDNVRGLQEAEPSKRGRPKISATPEKRELRAMLLHEANAMKAKNPAISSDLAACKNLLNRWLREQPGHALVGKSVTHLRAELRRARKESVEDNLALFAQLVFGDLIAELSSDSDND